MKSQRLLRTIGGVLLLNFCCLALADSAVAHPPPSRKASKKTLAVKSSRIHVPVRSQMR